MARLTMHDGQASDRKLALFDNEPIVFALIRGTKGDDSLDGGSGSDTIRGFKGDDLLDGKGGDDTLIGGDGNDRLHGRGESDDLAGDAGKDTLIGGAGNDVMHGGDSDDLLLGGSGADTLFGGAGTDRLAGGPGADTFHFSNGGTAADAANADVITDFSQAEGDKIDLSDYDADPSTRRDDPFTFIETSAFSGAGGELRYELINTYRLVSGDTDGDKVADFTIRLPGAGALTETDFLFAATPPNANHLPWLSEAGNYLAHFA